MQQTGDEELPMAAKTTIKPLPFPMFDGDRMIALQQRNLDAWASASQIVVDSVKAIAQRQSEMLQSSVDHWIANGQGALAGKPGEFKPADQLATAKSSYEAAVNNAKELAEIAIKAQSEAVDVLTKCMMANIDDLKSLAKAA
jgi:phasin family protein